MGSSSQIRTGFRILMTVDAVGGVWQYAVDLVRELSQRGCQVLMALMGPGASNAQKQQVSGLPGVRLRERACALEWMPDPWPDVDAAGEWLLELAHDFQPDLLHLNEFAHGALPWRRPVVVVAHSCVLTWWRAVHKAAAPATWQTYYERVRAGLLAADLVVAPTKTMACGLQAEYHVPQLSVQVIHNGTRSYALDGIVKQRKALAAGRFWDEAKNLRLLAAFPALPKLPIELAGDGSNANTHPAYLHSLGTLPHAAMLERMAEANIFLHPSLYEPFGLAVLEAAVQRCSLVLADIPSLRELWDGAALFVDPHDASAWLNQINRLADDPEAASRWGAQAAHRAGDYSSRRMAEQTLALYAGGVCV